MPIHIVMGAVPCFRTFYIWPVGLFHMRLIPERHSCSAGLDGSNTWHSLSKLLCHNLFKARVTSSKETASPCWCNTRLALGSPGPGELPLRQTWGSVSKRSSDLQTLVGLAKCHRASVTIGAKSTLSRTVDNGIEISTSWNQPLVSGSRHERDKAMGDVGTFVQQRRRSL